VAFAGEATGAAADPSRRFPTIALSLSSTEKAVPHRAQLEASSGLLAWHRGQIISAGTGTHEALSQTLRGIITH